MKGYKVTNEVPNKQHWFPPHLPEILQSPVSIHSAALIPSSFTFSNNFITELDRILRTFLHKSFQTDFKPRTRCLQSLNRGVENPSGVGEMTYQGCALRADLIKVPLSTTTVPKVDGM